MTAKAPVQAAVTILVLCMGIGYEIWGLQQIDWSNPESIILMIIASTVMMITIWYIWCLVFETSKKLIMDKEGCTVSVWGQVFFQETHMPHSISKVLFFLQNL